MSKKRRPTDLKFENVQSVSSAAPSEDTIVSPMNEFQVETFRTSTAESCAEILSSYKTTKTVFSTDSEPEISTHSHTYSEPSCAEESFCKVPIFDITTEKRPRNILT
eukprot:UN32977